MCEGCYAEYGRPAIRTDATIAASKLVAAVYEHSAVGGNLHVQLDDWNLEDEFWSEFKNYHDASAEQLAVEKACHDAFKSLTLPERASALAIERGYLGLGKGDGG